MIGQESQSRSESVSRRFLNDCHLTKELDSFSCGLTVTCEEHDENIADLEQSEINKLGIVCITKAKLENDPPILHRSA